MKTEYQNHSNWQLNIDIIKYRVILESSDSTFGNFTHELDLDESYTYTPIFTRIGIYKIVSVYFKISTKALAKIIDFLTNGKIVVLKFLLRSMAKFIILKTATWYLMKF
jgi:hypothetical protein